MTSETWRNEINLDQFWALVDLARTNFPAFTDRLMNADRRELIRFAWVFEELASFLGEKRFRKYTNPDFSEDSTDDLWEEVVGRGRAFYKDVLTHPQKMPAEIDPSDPSHKMRYQAGKIFFERFGEEIPPFSFDY